MNHSTLEKIKSSLPKGHRITLSKITGYSPSHVDAVLSGRRFNQTILDSAIELIEAEAAKKAEREARLNKAITSIEQI